MTSTTSSSRGRALVVSGGGRYRDEWHPFAETSRALAEVLTDRGLDVQVADEVDRALADLRAVDLLVLNIGAPDGDDGADASTRAGLLDHLERGRPLLVQHVSVTSLPAVPEWGAIVGAAWIEGTTMHPDLGTAHVHVHPTGHPIVAGLADFELEDERYTRLDVDPTVVPLLSHVHEGERFPLLWAHRFGGARVVYDALGHDGRSYRSPEHRRLLAGAADWLLEQEG